jgi:hypothetical protein
MKEVAKNQNMSLKDVNKVYDIIRKEILKFVSANYPKDDKTTISLDLGLIRLYMMRVCKRGDGSVKCDSVGINLSPHADLVIMANPEFYVKKFLDVE